MMTRLMASHSETVDEHKMWLWAIFYMAVSAFCFALVEMIGKVTVRGVSPYELIWVRYAVHLLFMGAVLGPRYKTQLVQTSHLKLQIVRGLCMLGMPVCYLLGAQSLPINDVWSVYWLSPLIALGLSSVLLHEAAGWQRWAAVLVGFAGALFILHPDRGAISPAIIFPIGMGVCFSLHLALSRVLRIEHPLVSLFYTALGVFIPLS
ncbi:MAG TPA: DMT family transporter, partial [Phototrophicaceae bacterium]|nr:DMT family transporter [Phototrophicaceae bacterium]